VIKNYLSEVEIKMQFEIFINGKNYRFTKSITVDQLITFLNCNKNAIALEYNQTILKQEDWTKTLIQSDDTLEIVTIVGGG
jgi:sulfur carrier protein